VLNWTSLAIPRKQFVCFFSPIEKSKVISYVYPNFILNGQQLQFVTEFRYLGHYIKDNMKDDADIKREIRNMYSRTNMLLLRFGKCSLTVKMCLFRSYCLCLYGTALWSKYNATTLLQLKYC